VVALRWIIIPTPRRVEESIDEGTEATPRRSFRRSSPTTMTRNDITSGRLTAYIGIAPITPAEFVIFQFS
jgi:phage tail sheath protein FI